MDIQILLQSLCYFVLCACGFIVSITTGVNRNRFGGDCILYATFKKNDDLTFVMEPSDPPNCNFPVYYGVFGMILWGLALGIYNMYALCKSRRDPTIGTQMWVMPFLMANTVLSLVSIIVACMVSVGFALFCDHYLDAVPKFITQCSAGQDKTWHKYPDTSKTFNPGNYVDFMTFSMIGAWTGVLFQLLQVALGITRFVRNRKSRGVGTQTMVNDDTGTTEEPPKNKELQPRF